MNIEEAIKDHETNLAELTDFYQQSKCEHNKIFLDSEIKRLKIKINELKKSLDVNTDKKVIRYKNLESYSWEQTNDQIKIYLTKDNFKEDNLKRDKIRVELMDNDRTVIIFIDHFRLIIKNLNDSIKINNDQLVKITKNFVIITLIKNENINWPSLQKTSQTKVNKSLDALNTEDNEDPSKAMMNIMKKMYQEGDDEMKRMINKAWSENSKNKF